MSERIGFVVHLDPCLFGKLDMIAFSERKSTDDVLNSILETVLAEKIKKNDILSYLFEEE